MIVFWHIFGEILFFEFYERKILKIVLDDDGKEITDQNGMDLPKKRSNRLAGKQKIDYRLLNGI